MNNLDFNKKESNSLKSFFSEYGLSQDNYYNTDGSHNLSVDGSGYIPSINESNNDKIKDFIKKYFKIKNNGKLKVLDIGSGLCYLQKSFDEDDYFESYSFEGSKELINDIVCDKSKVSICDLSKKINDERLKKAFHLTTSFELFEHIHRSHQDILFENLRYLSDYHLCSIHVANEEDERHCTIISPREWENIFKKIGFGFEKIGEYPVSQDKSKEIFRDFTDLWEWKYSVIYFLKTEGKQNE